MSDIQATDATDDTSLARILGEMTPIPLIDLQAENRDYIGFSEQFADIQLQTLEILKRKYIRLREVTGGRVEHEYRCLVDEANGRAHRLHCERLKRLRKVMKSLGFQQSPARFMPALSLEAKISGRRESDSILAGVVRSPQIMVMRGSPEGRRVGRDLVYTYALTESDPSGKFDVLVRLPSYIVWVNHGSLIGLAYRCCVRREDGLVMLGDQMMYTIECQFIEGNDVPLLDSVEPPIVFPSTIVDVLIMEGFDLAELRANVRSSIDTRILCQNFLAHYKSAQATLAELVDEYLEELEPDERGGFKLPQFQADRYDFPNTSSL